MPHPSLDEIPDAGGQDGWVWAVPLPYQALAAPWSSAPMPATPHDMREDEGRFEHEIGYYASLQSFLAYSFAWTRPDKGLMWWFANGMPTDDPRLELIAGTWHSDGTLLGYLAWLATRRTTEMTASTLNMFVTRHDESPLAPTPLWLSRLHRAREVEPWTGGSDPFHLGQGDHVAAPSRRNPRTSSGAVGATSETSRIVGLDGPNRTSTFVSDEIGGWYAGLFRAGNQLPTRNDERNWHVDVFVKPIGFLGTYRRSNQTGLWFSGQHRYHSIGN